MHIAHAHTQNASKPNTVLKLIPPTPASGKVTFCVWIDAMVTSRRTDSSYHVRIALGTQKTRQTVLQGCLAGRGQRLEKQMIALMTHSALHSCVRVRTLGLLFGPYLFSSFSDSAAGILPKPVLPITSKVFE